jgi:hypothetical protein
MNPFDSRTDPDRHYLWHRLVEVDCEAFAAGNWQLVESDFDAESFEGIRCFHSANPDKWRVAFPDLPSYRESWLAASAEYRKRQFVGFSHREALMARTHLQDIEVTGDRALAHKTFFGEVQLLDGSVLNERRQTLFRLHRRDGVWKTVGFLGQLPLESP